jgi:hypothetical protein
MPSIPRNLTPPSLLAQGRRSHGPCKPDGKLATAIAKTCILAPSSSMLTIPGVVVERRAAPTPPHRPGSPLGELRCRPRRARVSTPLILARGRRRPPAIDGDLIGRPTASDTGLARPAADRRTLPVGAPGCRPHSLLGRPYCESARSVEFRPVFIYFSVKFIC